MENTTATNTEVNTSAVTKEVKKSKLSNLSIYRNTDNKIIAGVCSGIADHYNIDPIIVRLIAAMGFLTFGVGPLVYLLLWIVLPVKHVVSQKEAQGQTANTDAIQGALSS